MSTRVKHIVIVGGGTAGWITAGTIAAAHGNGKGRNLKITLIESPRVKSLGVGEGTWPSMRNTLKNIGISETGLIRHCDASFKQGSKFIGWRCDSDKSYQHPFTLPAGWGEVNLAYSWLQICDQVSFADAVSAQSHVTERCLAPKEIVTPEYACVLNYGYHLDAGKFAKLLKDHCCGVLGVNYVSADVASIEVSNEGYIVALQTAEAGRVEGDLFVDCSGFTSLLLGEYYNVPFIDKSSVLFNDSALTVHVPYEQENNAIESYTQSTAKSSGWIWDIGLQSRRGIGYVYSSCHASDDAVEQELREYLKATAPEDIAEQAEFRKISFQPGYREQAWVKNCVAIGVSAGFIEPLEASALVMIELAAEMLAEQMPATTDMMEPLARRFNDKFRYRWERVIDFLKLHYVLSNRVDSDYWNDNKSEATVPQSLQDLLCLWRYQPPWVYDTLQRDELFSSASFQYVLYGMGFATETKSEVYTALNDGSREAKRLFENNIKHARRLLGRLPTNRELLNRVRNTGFQSI